jgi:macrocin-O-methyltransferase TylF-like protien
MSREFESLQVHLPENQRPQDDEYYRRLNEYYARSAGSHVDKLRAFPKFVPVAELGRFLAKSRIFERVLGVPGSVVECGVFGGGGLMTWAALSAILEPLNHVRRVIGFDTFEGFVRTSAKDASAAANPSAVAGALAADAAADIEQSAAIFDLYRPLGHIPKIELVKGDALTTIPEYVDRNTHLVVSLLYLDFDLYEPTKCALERFVPRMPKGAVIAFDELNHRAWPGETMALLDTLGIRSLRLERMPFQPQISFACLE